jgi:hypothetical protein
MVLLFVVITWLIYSRAHWKALVSIDVSKMRRVYVALSVYEMDNNGHPAPDLYAIRRDLADDTLLRCDLDPWKDSTNLSFPLDPELPSDGETSPVRISFSYLMNFIRNKKTSEPSWATIETDPRIGILTDGWHGSVEETGQPFSAKLGGTILRLNMDGSFFSAPPRSGDGEMGNADALFFKR